MKIKKCARCGEEKNLKDFYKRKEAKKIQPYSWCKECQKKLTKAYGQARHESKWAGLLEKKYGITKDEFERRVEEQGGVCFICKENPDGKRLSVDHCHTTKRVRALLCRNHNLMIGLSRDNPDILIAAAEYLKSHSGLTDL